MPMSDENQIALMREVAEWYRWSREVASALGLFQLELPLDPTIGTTFPTVLPTAEEVRRSVLVAAKKMGARQQSAASPPEAGNREEWIAEHERRVAAVRRLLDRFERKPPYTDNVARRIVEWASRDLKGDP